MTEQKRRPGRPKTPDGTKPNQSIRVSDALWNAAKSRAEREGEPFAAVVERLLTTYVEEPTMTTTAGRILISTLGESRPAIRDAEVAQQYRDALADGTILRESETPGDDPYFARVIEYVDPIDGTTRYAVHQADPAEEEITDYADRAAAETQYEQDVRDSVEADMPYKSTDVAELHDTTA